MAQVTRESPLSSQIGQHELEAGIRIEDFFKHGSPKLATSWHPNGARNFRDPFEAPGSTTPTRSKARLRIAKSPTVVSSIDEQEIPARLNAEGCP